MRERDDAARRQQLAAEEAARQIAERDATIASLEGRAKAAEADAAARRTQLQRTAALGAQLHGIQELLQELAHDDGGGGGAGGGSPEVQAVRSFVSELSQSVAEAEA